MKKKAVLIIHGFLGCIDDNLYLEKSLRKIGCDVFSYSLPGCEDNFKMKNTSRNDWIDFSYNILDKLIDDNYQDIVLIGHSLGGIIASIIATNDSYIKYISKVILIAPAINYYGINYTKRLYLRRVFRNFNFLFDRNKPNPHNLKKASLKAFFEFLKFSNEHRELIFKIKAPLLIVHGNRDKVIPVEYSRELFRNIENGNKVIIEIDGGNHWLFLYSKKEETFRVIWDFIK